jgi:hypothetical protein
MHERTDGISKREREREDDAERKRKRTQRWRYSTRQERLAIWLFQIQSRKPCALLVGNSLMGQGSQLLFAEFVVDGVASSVLSGERWGTAWQLTPARAASDLQ